MYSFFFFKQKTAYEVRISDWSSDVCSSDLPLEHTLRMAVRGIHNDHIHARSHQRRYPFFGVAADANRRAHQQALIGILGGIGVVARFLDILHRDQAAQLESLVHHQYLLYAMLVHQDRKSTRLNSSH